MSFQQILSPELPYVGEVKNGLTPGKMVKVQGKVPLESTRFAINYQLGPVLNPRDDIALHVSPRFHEGFVTRNHIKSMTWGTEENDGPMWIKPGLPFEIIILCEYQCYKIAINGKHFTEFAHRLPYEQVSHLVIDGEVEIISIFYETITIDSKPPAPVTDVPNVIIGPPAPGKLYPTLYPNDFPEEKNKPITDTDEFKNNLYHAYEFNPKQESESVTNDCLDKVGLAVGGLVAAGGVAAALHAYNKNKNKHSKNFEQFTHEKSETTQNESGLGTLGTLGAALANSITSNNFEGNKTISAQHGYAQTGGMLESIMGTLGGNQSVYQQPSPDPLSGTLNSILGGVLGSSGYQQTQYYPSRNNENYPNDQSLQGNNLLSGLGSVLMKSAVDGLSKHLHSSHNGDDHNTHHFSLPAPSINVTHNNNMLHTLPSASESGQLTATEISKGLGLSNKDN